LFCELPSIIRECSSLWLFNFQNPWPLLSKSRDSIWRWEKHMKGGGGALWCVTSVSYPRFGIGYWCCAWWRAPSWSGKKTTGISKRQCSKASCCCCSVFDLCRARWRAWEFWRRYIVVNEEDTASSKDMPSTTVVHPHHIAVHKVPTTPFDASVTPAYAINSIPDPVPTVPAFVADSVPMNSSTGTQILLTDDAVPAAAASVSSSAPIASSLATPTHEVGLVQHSNPRNQHDMELSQRIKDCDKRAAEAPFILILSKTQK